MGRAIALCSSPAPPGWLLPPASPDLPSLPPMPPGLMWPGWSFGRGVLTWELSRLPGPELAGQLPSTPLSFFAQSPSHLPLQISPPSGAPILSSLHFSSPLSPPTSYQFILRLLPSPWSSESPTSGQQEPWLCGAANSTSSHTAVLTLPPPIMYF